MNDTSKQYGPGDHSSLDTITRDRSPVRFPALTLGSQNINNQDNRNVSDIPNLGIQQDFRNRRQIKVQGRPNTTTQQDVRDRGRAGTISRSAGRPQGHQNSHGSHGPEHLDWNKKQHPHSNRDIGDSELEYAKNMYRQGTSEGYFPRISQPQPQHSNDPATIRDEVNTFLAELAKDIDKAKDDSQGRANKTGNVTTCCNLPTCQQLLWPGQSSDKERSHNADRPNKTCQEIPPWMEPHHIPHATHNGSQINNQTQSRQGQQNKRPGGHHLNTCVTNIKEKITQKGRANTVTGGAIIKRNSEIHRSAGLGDRLNFHRDQQGIIIKTNAGHSRCNYCFIASHARDICKYRRIDMENGIDRLVHPNKGLLQSRKDKSRSSHDGGSRDNTHLVTRTPRQYRQYYNKHGTNGTGNIIPMSTTHKEQDIAYRDIQLPTGIEFTNINFKSDITTRSTREHKQQTGHPKRSTGCDENHKKEINPFQITPDISPEKNNTIIQSKLTLNDMPNEVMAII